MDYNHNQQQHQQKQQSWVKETKRCVKGIDYEVRSQPLHYNYRTDSLSINIPYFKLLEREVKLKSNFARKIKPLKNLYYTLSLITNKALKQFKRSQLKNKQSSAYLDIMREIDLLKELNHPNITRLHEVIDDERDDKLYLVLDYAERGQIMDFDTKEKRFKLSHDSRSQFTEKEIQSFARDLVQAIDYIHSCRILHCDIKPQNVLVDENGVAKLADFGTAQMYQETDTQMNARGTYEFLAPECCDPNQKQYSGKAADIWALGVTIYCLTFNEVPFPGTGTNLSILRQIQNEQLNFEGKRQISDSLKRFLIRILEKDPKKRYTMEQIKKDEWINDGHHQNLLEQTSSLVFKHQSTGVGLKQELRANSGNLVGEKYSSNAVTTSKINVEVFNHQVDGRHEEEAKSQQYRKHQ